MSQVEIAIPQMGEGLQEVRIVQRHKAPGDTVARDELLYTMETDKALMEVESPYEGVLEAWLAAEDDVVPIGAPIARLQTSADATSDDVPRDAGAAFSPATNGSKPLAARSATSSPGNLTFPPRTRAMCRELGIGEDEMRLIPAPSGKLLPADVQAYRAAQQQAADAPVTSPGYVEKPLSPQQRTFIYRARRSAQVVIPATMKRPMPWHGLLAHVEAIRALGDLTDRPTEFQTFAFCVAQAARAFPKFRSVFAGEDAVRQHPHLNLGIAVARPDGDLVTAVVSDADTLDYEVFIHTAQASIQRARDGADQATAATQLLLTYLGPYGITDGVPVLVAPAIAILLLGAPSVQDGQLVANLVLTFDHRLINGVEAAQFLQAVVAQVEETTA